MGGQLQQEAWVVLVSDRSGGVVSIHKKPCLIDDDVMGDGQEFCRWGEVMFSLVALRMNGSKTPSRDRPSFRDNNGKWQEYGVME
jgi:hypothetical protein